MDAFKTVTDFFDSSPWSYVRDDDTDSLFLALSCGSGPLVCRARVWQKRKLFIFHTNLVVETPDEKRDAMARLLIRANNTTPLGNFELDRYGQIRFKTAVDYRGGELTENLIRNTVYENIRAAQKYLSAIVAVLETDAMPDEAFDNAQTRDFLTTIRREFDKQGGDSRQ